MSWPQCVKMKVASCLVLIDCIEGCRCYCTQPVTHVFIIAYTSPLTMLTVRQRKKITVVTFFCCPAVVLTRRPTKRRSVTCHSFWVEQCSNHSGVEFCMRYNTCSIVYEAAWLIQDIGILAWLPRRTSDSKPSYPTGLENSLGPVSISDKTSFRKISWSLEATRLVL